MLQILNTLDDLGDKSSVHRPNMCKWLVGSKVETQDCNNSYLGIERFFFNRKDLFKKQFCKGIYQIILWEQNLNGSQAKFPSQDPYKTRLISHSP